MKLYAQDFFSKVYARLLETKQDFIFLPNGEMVSRENCEEQMTKEEKDKVFQEWGKNNILS